ncbi:MAG: hypothetical protein JWM45_3509 [Pseudonocardiales bacterium]|nr:hypothetical protein [Pseudonocardiales bacterium]
MTKHTEPADPRPSPIAEGPRRPPDEVLELRHGFAAEIYCHRKCAAVGMPDQQRVHEKR